MPTDVGIVGAGYVGLPLAVEFGRAGRTVVCVEADGRRVEAIGRGESYVEDVDSEALAELVSAGTVSATGEYAALGDAETILICLPTPLSTNREPDLTSHRRHLADRPPPAPRPARRARVDELPGHDARGAPADPGVQRPAWRRGLPPRDVARAHRSGRTDYTVRTTPKVVGGLTRRLPRPGDRRLQRAASRIWCRSSSCDAAELDEAAREHLPVGEHRAGERARDAVPPHGAERLGGRRRGGDQAVRLHALLARAGPGRPLPPDRPVLPLVEGAGVRLPGRSSSSSPAR